MGNSILDAALDYAAKSWPIFPVKRDKTPFTPNGVLDATTNPRQIERWWKQWPEANVALDVGGSGMMVLDLDPGHDLKELENAIGPLPETRLRADTPRGGQHLYFSLGQGEVVAASASKIALHVDVRSFHSYVLLPPSSTKDGTYGWVEEDKPHFRTDEMVRVANSAREKHADRDAWLIEPDLKENISNSTTWLRTQARPAIEGQGGDHCAYATAAMCKSYGVSEELAFDLMWEHWNPRCVPPWSSDEADHLKAKVKNAYAYNTSPPGNLTPAYKKARAEKLFQPVLTTNLSGDETIIAGFRFADRLALRHIRPPDWIVKDFIPDEAYTMLFGAYSTFKTFLALDLALRVAAGHQPADDLWSATRHGPVLFAAGEGRSNMAKRVGGWELRHNWGAEVSGFTLVDPVPTTGITEDRLNAFIDEALRRHPEGYALTVIDTVGRAMEGQDENAQAAASAFTALVQRLRAELGGSILALHHSGHQEERRARGSSVFGADPDTLVRVDREGKSSLVTLTITKQKDAPEWEHPRRAKLEEVHLAAGGDTLVAVEPGEEERSSDGRAANMIFMEVLDRALADLLKSNPSRFWTQRDVAEALAMGDTIKVPSKQLQGHLVRLRETSGTIANRCYDPTRNQRAGRWQWRAN